jgi:hypothetical protein
LAVARSGCESPLKSPTATELGVSPEIAKSVEAKFSWAKADGDAE